MRKMSKQSSRRRAAREVPEVRDSAVRTLNATNKMMLALNFLFSQYEISAHSDADIAVEFSRCYRHLLLGGKIQDLPIRLLDKSVKDSVNAVFNGELHQTRLTKVK